MPVSDPTAGRLFIWLISTFLFVCIAAGGSFLITYIVLPQSSPWLPIAGVSLVCLPWMFWFITCFYRIISRSCGFRVMVGGSNPSVRANGGGGGGGGGAETRSLSNNVFNTPPAPVPNAAPDDDDEAEAGLNNVHASSPTTPMESTGRRVQFGGTKVLGEQDHDHSKKSGNMMTRSLSTSNSNNMSVASHESELPLTSAMK